MRSRTELVLRALLLALLAGVVPLPAVAQARRSTPEDARERVARLSRALGAGYQVPDSVADVVLATLPARAKWAMCSRPSSAFDISCKDASPDSTALGCRAAAIGVLATRATTLGDGRATARRLKTEMTCASHRVTMAMAGDGGSELREVAMATGEVVYEGRAPAPPAEVLAEPDEPAGGSDAAARPAGDSAAGSTSRSHGQPPDVINRPGIARRLQEAYPKDLLESHIGGTANVWMFVDEKGRVFTTLLQKSSGYHELDAAALAVALKMKFRPAKLDGEPVAVWIAMPIVFATR